MPALRRPQGNGYRRSGSHVHLAQPFPINLRRNFRWLDLAASAPENVRVCHWDAARTKMSIYRRFVFEEPLLIRAVRYGHDVDVLKLGTGFAPIAMGEDVMPTDFAACLNLATLRNRPVKQRIETRDTNASSRRFDVFQKS